jgi:hypothetical protein
VWPAETVRQRDSQTVGTLTTVSGQREDEGVLLVPRSLIVQPTHTWILRLYLRLDATLVRQQLVLDEVVNQQTAVVQLVLQEWMDGNRRSRRSRRMVEDILN